MYCSDETMQTWTFPLATILVCTFPLETCQPTPTRNARVSLSVAVRVFEYSSTSRLRPGLWLLLTICTTHCAMMRCVVVFEEPTLR